MADSDSDSRNHNRGLVLRLPETIRTPRGLTVEGASASLLADLLDAYKYEIERRDPRAWDGFRQGHSRQEIVDKFAAEGLIAPEELVVWWSWSDGHQMMPTRGLRNVPIGLDRALRLHREDREDGFVLLPGPEWVRIVGQGRRTSIALSCESEDKAPLVGLLDVEQGLGPRRLSDLYAVSLCTPVTWWLTSLVEGWVGFDRNQDWWTILDLESAPIEWQLTQLL